MVGQNNVAAYFFPFLKIFLSVFDFSKGKNHFFSKKFSNNGLGGVKTKSDKNHFFFNPFLNQLINEQSVSRMAYPLLKNIKWKITPVDLPPLLVENST